METDLNELAAGPRKYFTAILEQQTDMQPVSLQGTPICNLIL